MNENVLLNTYTTCLSAMGISVSLQNLQDSLNVVLLALSIINFLIAIIPSFVKKIKEIFADKKVTKEELKELYADISVAINQVQTLAQSIKKNDESKDEAKSESTESSWDPVNAKSK